MHENSKTQFDHHEPLDENLVQKEPEQTSLAPSSSTDQTIPIANRAEQSAGIKHLRESAPIGAFKTMNAIYGFSALVGGMIGFWWSVSLLPQKYYYLIPWPQTGTRFMPPVVFGVGLVGLLVGMTITTTIVMVVYSVICPRRKSDS